MRRYSELYDHPTVAHALKDFGKPGGFQTQSAVRRCLNGKYAEMGYPAVPAPSGKEWDEYATRRLIRRWTHRTSNPAPRAEIVASAATLFDSLKAAGATTEEAMMTVFQRHAAGRL